MYWFSAFDSSLHRVGHTVVLQGFDFCGSPQSGPLAPPTWQAGSVGSTGWSIEPDLSTSNMKFGLFFTAFTSELVWVCPIDSGATGSKS